MKTPQAQLEIFCGTGGVGKSTLSAGRALSLASQENKVLLITIDPAKRLRDILGLKSKQSGHIQSVDLENFLEKPKGSLDVLLMNPHATLTRLAPDEAENRILKILTKPHGGTNEIMAVVELDYQMEQGNYDVIILDTAPGKHFIDFLESAEKIRTFFDKSFVEYFLNLEKKNKKLTGLFTSLLSEGVKKILSYFSQVTGPEFIDEFVQAVKVIYEHKDSFLNALSLEDKLKNPKFCRWYLVACAEQDKINEALELEKNAKNFLHHKNILILNKSLLAHLETWDPLDKNLLQLKDALVSKEKALLLSAKTNFSEVIIFPQILEDSLKKQMVVLANYWTKEI